MIVPCFFFFLLIPNISIKAWFMFLLTYKPGQV